MRLETIKGLCILPECQGALSAMLKQSEMDSSWSIMYLLLLCCEQLRACPQ
jgi:hypothetical protein